MQRHEDVVPSAWYSFWAHCLGTLLGTHGAFFARSIQKTEGKRAEATVFLTVICSVNDRFGMGLADLPPVCRRECTKMRRRAPARSRWARRADAMPQQKNGAGPLWLGGRTAPVTISLSRGQDARGPMRESVAHPAGSGRSLNTLRSIAQSTSRPPFEQDCTGCEAFTSLPPAAYSVMSTALKHHLIFGPFEQPLSNFVTP
jgi:hypothetical protein